MLIYILKSRVSLDVNPACERAAPFAVYNMVEK